MAAFRRIEPWSMSTDSNWHAIHEGITTVALIPHGGKRDDEYPLAIARMAMAAPELLEALRTLVPSEEQEAGWWCRQCVAETGATNDERCVNCGEPFGDPHEAEAIRVARAAIAKAEGNQ